MRVTEAARCVFHVGLELINRIAEIFVSRRLHRDQGAQKTVAIFSDQSPQDFVLEILGDCRIADQESAIEEGGVRFHVGLVELPEVIGVPNLVPDLELEIPQGMQDRFDGLLVDRLLEEKEKINIGLRMNHSSPVTTD